MNDEIDGIVEWLHLGPKTDSTVKSPCNMA